MGASAEDMMDRQETVERFRQRLGELIDRSRLNQSAFARQVGIDRSTLSQILSGTTDRLPRVETLASIASTEQVSLDWLLGLTEEGPLSADLMPQSLEISPAGGLPSDEQLEKWHEEAIGYKIRHVPTSLPDVLKSDEVIEYEYRRAATATPEARREMTQARRDYQRRPEADTEVCMPLQSLHDFSRGHGLWQDLEAATRKRQLAHMLTLTRELYPRFRWFLFDLRQRYSVPLTIFGPKRAAIYVGQMYFVLSSREHIRALSTHFDDLIRAAVVQPTEVGDVLTSLHDEL
jgi:transcriptional regulator with XRE-family HTH domain